jgi:hypothetical protein
MEERWKEGCRGLKFVGKACPQARQRLAAPKVCAAQQKQIIETALVLSGFLQPVVLELVTAKRVHDFTLPPGVLKVIAAGMPEHFGVNQLFFQGALPFGQNGPAEAVKLQFGCTDSGFQLRPPPRVDVRHLTVYIFDLLAQRSNSEIGFLQPQLLLPLQALPDAQQDFERESECHEC